MMMNLFSIFDPSSSMNWSLNWMSSMLAMMILPNMYWLIPSRWMMMFMIILNFMINEFKMILNIKLNMMNLIILISLMMNILLNNLMGLCPYIFTSSSHLTMSLSYSMMLWLAMMMFGWYINTNHMFIHLVPMGTPMILMPLMVIIETISNIIRPLTLAIRLSANMISGHLLLTLISSMMNNINILMFNFILFSQTLLMLLELSVAMIQSYVFSVLLMLYSIESN